MMKDGEAIQVEADDAKDVANRDKIGTHLTEIAKMFQNGNFRTPFAVLSEIPPGVSEMEKLKAEIRYSYEETGRAHASGSRPIIRRLRKPFTGL